MTRRILLAARLLAIPALLAFGSFGAPAVSAGNPCFHDFTMPPATTEAGTEVKLLSCAFAPTVTQVAVGAKVTFFNGPDFTHLITGANQEWGSPDVELQPGQTISYTFDTAGIYPFACILHPGMSGAIVVGDLAQALAAGTTDGSTSGVSTGGSNPGGGSSGAGSNATGASAATPPSNDPAPASPVLLPVGIGGGVLIGASAVWLALRRRSQADGTLARAE